MTDKFLNAIDRPIRMGPPDTPLQPAGVALCLAGGGDAARPSSGPLKHSLPERPQ